MINNDNLDPTRQGGSAHLPGPTLISAPFFEAFPQYVNSNRHYHRQLAGWRRFSLPQDSGGARAALMAFPGATACGVFSFVTGLLLLEVG